jgi:hypothetical protein
MQQYAFSHITICTKDADNDVDMRVAYQDHTPKSAVVLLSKFYVLNLQSTGTSNRSGILIATLLTDHHITSCTTIIIQLWFQF